MEGWGVCCATSAPGFLVGDTVELSAPHLHVYLAPFLGTSAPGPAAAVAAATLDIASFYKSHASETRIGLPLNANLAAATKARGVIAERAGAKQAFENKHIRIDASLYKLATSRNQEKLLEVRFPNVIAILVVYCPTDSQNSGIQEFCSRQLYCERN
jgi:hypothetical protein